MDGVVGDYALRLAHVIAAGVEVAVEAGKVTAADFNAQFVTRGEINAGLHRLKRNLVNLVLLHKHGRFVISLAIADTLDVFIDVISGSIGQRIDKSYSEVG